ncbi:PhnE/PtxC family ABC transporter permease [Erysipelothrix aquatica]|uniref:PhnE/PtxC family ABC transporter permease n=1 Tax=Erysipelothrix aquatica TaxID=2683714 RepID=UPI0013590B47|nr:ABC transporter permease subunit [Erysipelothrix aquatica]
MRPEDLTLTTSKQVARKRIRVKHGPTQRQNRRFMVGATILVIVSLWYVKLDFSMFVANIDKTYGIIGRLLNPNWTMALPYLTSFIDTLAIAFVALLTALLFALPIAYLTASNTAPFPKLARVLLTLFSLIRAVPITIWGLVGAASIGFGSQAGVLGLFLPTISYLARILAHRIEEAGYDIIEAMSASGTPWLVMVFRGITQELMPQLIATVALRFELTTSETISLGMVGIAGIGYTLNMSIGTYNFENASMGILIIFIGMWITEYTTRRMVSWIRKER